MAHLSLSSGLAHPYTVRAPRAKLDIKMSKLIKYQKFRCHLYSGVTSIILLKGGLLRIKLLEKD